VIKCLTHGFRSDVKQLPPIGRLPRASSRMLYRATIATLHFLQPFARLHGRFKGMVSVPADLTPAIEHDHVPPRRSAFSDLADGVRLCVRGQVERTFWSERWVEACNVLWAMADRLRRQRIVRNVELDSGWWEDRDVTMVDQAWFRLDIRALVEDHGSGRCLCRVAMRSRVTATPLLALGSGLAIAIGLQRAELIDWPLGALFVAVWTAALPVAHMALAARVVSKTLDSLAAELGLAPLVPVDDRSDMVLPHSIASALSPAVARGTPSSPVPHKATARMSPHGSAVSAGFAGESSGGIARIGVMNLDKTNI
jgi:hypothetical protein